STVERRIGTCQAARDMTVALPLSDWRELGVKDVAGRQLPAGDRKAALVSGVKRQFLVNDNYDALLAYNCAHAYAISVALLSDRISAPAASVAANRRPARH